jgi:Domain of unknown function (DUF4394)
MKLSRIGTLITVLSVATMFELVSVARSAVGVALTGLAGNTLVFFDSATPGTTTTRSVAGTDGLLLGIDYRPADGQLYGITSDSVFTIDPISGNATLVNSIAGFTGGTTSGVDFNPAADALRITGANDQNLRIAGGGLGATIADTNLAYATTDINVGAEPSITASAYINSFAGAPGGRATQLFGIDSSLNVLVSQVPPNSGTLNTIGSLGVNIGTVGGFDIFSPNGLNIAFAALAPSSSTAAFLYTIDLGTGNATSLGQIGTGAGFSLTGLAAPIGAAPVPEPSAIPGLILFGIGMGWTIRRKHKRIAAGQGK